MESLSLCVRVKEYFQCVYVSFPLPFLPCIYRLIGKKLIKFHNVSYSLTVTVIIMITNNETNTEGNHTDKNKMFLSKTMPNTVLYHIAVFFGKEDACFLRNMSCWEDLTSAKIRSFWNIEWDFGGFGVICLFACLSRWLDGSDVI